jgi:transposase
MSKREYRLRNDLAPAAPPRGRIVGLDLHPDIFTVSLLAGRSAREARVIARHKDLPVAEMEAWAKQHLRAGDLVLMEAGTGSFEVVRRLESLGLSALVLESAQTGRVADAYLDDDTIASERIARSYLTGLAKVVWVPDTLTSERRELLHAHLKATEAETRAINELRGYLTQFQIRPGTRDLNHAQTREWVVVQREWSPLQRTLLTQHFERLAFATMQSEVLYAAICQEVLSDQAMAGCLRVLGIGPVNAFAAGAVIGDIGRFTSPEKLVNYLGLHPGRKQSGTGKLLQPGVGNRGRKEMRCLLVQAAQAVMRQKAGSSDLRDWGWRLFLRKGNRNVAVAAVARRLAEQLWHLLRGGCVTKPEQKRSLALKLSRMIRRIGAEARAALGLPKKTGDCVAVLMERIDHPRAITI